ncbi:glycosyltransferase [Nocardioides sp. URHA0020]|uniref:glycosyltransferase n=1 Tax=Nocardioides sp. URHA0020 TaxID=1380392 RepID=UPI000685E971|nr:glycosyltransferase [Nocardioides sp. URHA0020]
MAHASDGATVRPQVSVVVPSLREVDQIGRCLDSLAAQTLPGEQYEVVVVLHGREGTPAGAAAARERHPALRLRTVRSADPRGARARNLGIAAAVGRLVTFVDPDDRVGPGYLQALLGAAEPGVVPVAPVAEVVPGADPDLDTDLARRLRPRVGTTGPVDGDSAVLRSLAGTLVPTAYARRVGFDEDLRSGDDLVFWADLYARVPFGLHVGAVDEDAAYHRTVTTPVSEPGFEEAVEPLLDIIERLASRTPAAPDAQRLRQDLVVSVTKRLAAYLDRHPGDQQRVLDEIDRRGLDTAVDRRVLQGEMAHDLAILYAFTPYADTSAGVAARRVRARGVMVDVVSNTLDRLRGTDPGADVIVDRYVGRHHRVATDAVAFRWRPVAAFCREGLATVTRWVEEKGTYRSVYSRAMFPASHLLAAQVKLRWPGTRWIAEFSDPMLWDSRGERRTTGVRRGALLTELTEGLVAHGVRVPDDLDVPHLVELVTYALADEIHFTNELQMEFMLGYLPEQELVESIRSRAVVDHHPTLPPDFYHRVVTPVERTPGRVNLAYFGAFYTTRGLTEIVDALGALEPDERARIVLRVFTADPEELTAEVAAKGLADVVEAGPYVPYLEFLNLTTKMDVLLVNDARTKPHYPVNPYLPSKWSDYAGSGTDVWAVVEPGSMLDSMSTAYRSELGDVAGATAQLRRMIADLSR